MSDLPTLLERNRAFADQYTGGLQIMPKFSTFILTCADARIDPAHFFGLELGEAMVFRNAGGRVTDDVELELAVLWMMAARMAGDNFGGLSLMLVQHTDCGFERLANPDMAAMLSNRLGVEQATINDLANADHAHRLHEDIERLRRSRLAPRGLVVSGHIYHVEDGTIEEIHAPTAL